MTKILLRLSLLPPGAEAAAVAEPEEEEVAEEVEEAVEAEQARRLVLRDGQVLRALDHLAMLHPLFP